MVWPEVPAPFYYDDDPAFARVSPGNRRGQPGRTFWPGCVAHAPDGAPLNSAALIDPERADR